MGARQKAWARKARRALLEKHGAVCAICGHWRTLTLDVIVPVDRGDHHRRKDPSARVSFYRAQDRAGNLQVLCLGCNSRKAASDKAHYANN
jgi:5-methylcytosine-specific restriction endonuclease McrA